MVSLTLELIGWTCTLTTLVLYSLEGVLWA
jgi:hypothetical protein